jgi:hypothetical protein
MRCRIPVTSKRRVLCIFPAYSPSFGTFSHAYALMGRGPRVHAAPGADGRGGLAPGALEHPVRRREHATDRAIRVRLGRRGFRQRHAAQADRRLHYRAPSFPSIGAKKCGSNQPPLRVARKEIIAYGRGQIRRLGRDADRLTAPPTMQLRQQRAMMRR